MHKIQFSSNLVSKIGCMELSAISSYQHIFFLITLIRKKKIVPHFQFSKVKCQSITGKKAFYFFMRSCIDLQNISY